MYTHSSLIMRMKLRSRKNITANNENISTLIVRLVCLIYYLCHAYSTEIQCLLDEELCVYGRVAKARMLFSLLCALLFSLSHFFPFLGCGCSSSTHLFMARERIERRGKCRTHDYSIAHIFTSSHEKQKQKCKLPQWEWWSQRWQRTQSRWEMTSMCVHVRPMCPFCCASCHCHSMSSWTFLTSHLNTCWVFTAVRSHDTSQPRWGHQRLNFFVHFTRAARD